MAGSVLNLNQQTFEATIAKGVTLVDFWAPWCMPCRRLAPVLDQVAATIGTDAVVAKVNTDEDGELAARFNIEFIPTLIVFKDGTELHRFSAAQDEATLVDALRQALK